ncbi:hypothetical protein ACLMAJ_17765 [Nocardia sp. KC 131]|uniref:WXG100 family type VII secretion target n=1 Tax=Nocardia arseniciresistens TaxID=3392119 RepID=UPI00398E44D2
MADVWERLTKQAGKKFSIRNDTALKAAQAVAVTERGFMTIEGNCEALSFPAVGFGTLPGRNGERLGQVFVERKDALSDVLKEHLATLRHMRQMYMVTAKLIGSAEEETANAFRRLGIDPSAEYQLRFESNAQTAVADVFDKGRNSRDGHKNNKLLPEFVPGNASVQYRKSGVESWPADAMTWHDLWDLGRSVKPDPIRAAGEYWISFAYEIENLLVDLNKALDKAFTDWEGESQKAATAAHDRFQTEMAALHKGMFATGVELAFAAGWLASTPYGMPTESTPVYNGDDADDTTGHVRGEGYWDFLTSLTGIREYYKNSYLDGFKISRDRIPKFTPPKTTPKNDLKKEAERKKREEAERKKTVEYPRQKLNADQQQLTPQQIKKKAMDIGTGVPENQTQSEQPAVGADIALASGYPAPGGVQQPGGQLPGPGDPSGQPAGQSQLGQLAGMAQQAGNLAQQAGQGLPQAARLPDAAAKALNSALSAAEGKGPTAGGGRGAGGGAGGGPGPGSPGTPTHLRDYPASLFPRAGTELATGAVPPRAGPAPGQQPMTGTPGSPGSAAPHGAHGAGKGNGSDHKRPKYLQSAEHLDEALGEPPMVFKAVIDR